MFSCLFTQSFPHLRVTERIVAVTAPPESLRLEGKVLAGWLRFTTPLVATHVFLSSPSKHHAGGTTPRAPSLSR